METQQMCKPKMDFWIGGVKDRHNPHSYTYLGSPKGCFLPVHHVQKLALPRGGGGVRDICAVRPGNVEVQTRCKATSVFDVDLRPSTPLRLNNLIPFHVLCF